LIYELIHANWTNFRTLSSSTISDLNENWHDHAGVKGKTYSAKKIEVKNFLSYDPRIGPSIGYFRDTFKFRTMLGQLKLNNYNRYQAEISSH